MNDKLEEIRARHAAATPGPWRWFGYVKGRGIGYGRRQSVKRWCSQVYLATVNRGRIFVMQFERVGFNNAQPRFQRYSHPRPTAGGYSNERDGGGVMVGAGEMAGGPDGYLKEYSGEFVGIDNQDAIAIEKSWEDIDFLIGEVDRLQGTIDALKRLQPESDALEESGRNIYVFEREQIEALIGPYEIEVPS